MCIHNIVKNRGVWESIIHTRQHSYSVLKKNIRILPVGIQRDSSVFCKGTDGVTVTMDLAKTRLPMCELQQSYRLSSYEVGTNAKVIRGALVRAGLLSVGAVFW